jgi:hypothetical protein
MNNEQSDLNADATRMTSRRLALGLHDGLACVHISNETNNKYTQTPGGE